MSKPTPRLKWSRHREEDGGTSFWASTGKRHHDMCFAIWYAPPPARNRARAHIEMTAWVGPDDTPIVERTHTFTGDLAAFLRELPTYQRALILETAENLRVKADAVFALRRYTSPLT